MENHLLQCLKKAWQRLKEKKHTLHISTVEYIKFLLKQIIYSYKFPWKIKTTPSLPK